MSTAMNVVAAIAGSAPTAEYADPKTELTNAVRYGADAIMPAVGKKIGPIESMPATNCCPSSLSGLMTLARHPAIAHAMIM